MEEHIIYIAFDGEQFWNKDSCENYEYEIATNEMKCYDFNGQEVNIAKGGIEEVNMVKIESKSAYRMFINKLELADMETAGLDKVFLLGRYFYDGHNHRWVHEEHVRTLLEYYTDILEYYTDILERMEDVR